MPAADLNANAYYVNALCHPNRTSFAATHMDLEIVIPSELIQTKTIIMILIHAEYENMIQMNLSAKYKNINGLTDTEHKLMVTKGEKWRAGRIN